MTHYRSSPAIASFAFASSCFARHVDRTGRNRRWRGFPGNSTSAPRHRIHGVPHGSRTPSTLPGAGAGQEKSSWYHWRGWRRWHAAAIEIIARLLEEVLVVIGAAGSTRKAPDAGSAPASIVLSSRRSLSLLRPSHAHHGRSRRRQSSLNSLAGEAIARASGACDPSGRPTEIGSSVICMRNGHWPASVPEQPGVASASTPTALLIRRDRSGAVQYSSR